jgi:hypothetical protein
MIYSFSLSNKRRKKIRGIIQCFFSTKNKEKIFFPYTRAFSVRERERERERERGRELGRKK